jgi:hypothetical protein
MRTSRAELGCLEYTLSADPTDPGRVMLFERWARQEDLDAHLAAMRARPSSPGDLDLYGDGGTMFKTQLTFLYPAPIPAANGDLAEPLSGPNTGLLVNFRNRHVTVSPYLRPCLNTDCAKDGYLDISRYASPEGLMKIVQ